MKPSPEGIALTKSYEQCRLKAYKPTPEDKWTCGWGETSGVDESTVWTQEEADWRFTLRYAKAADCVNMYVGIPVTIHQFDALCDLAYNIGSFAFANSTLVRLLNLGDMAGAEQQFPRWDRQAGKELPGLLRRREDDMKEFDEPEEGA